MTSSRLPPEDQKSDDQQAIEWELVRRVVVEDDHAAFEQLVAMHQSSVRQFLRRMTAPDLARADDLAQETFFKAYRYLSSHRGDGTLRSWLFTVAYQLFVTDERGSKKTRFDELEVEPIATRIQGEINERWGLAQRATS